MKNLQFRCGRKIRAKAERSDTQITSSFYFALRFGMEIYVFAQVKLHLQLIKYFNSLVFPYTSWELSEYANGIPFHHQFIRFDSVFFSRSRVRFSQSSSRNLCFHHPLSLNSNFVFCCTSFHRFFRSIRFHQLTSHMIALLVCRLCMKLFCSQSANLNNCTTVIFYLDSHMWKSLSFHYFFDVAGVFKRIGFFIDPIVK